MKKTILGSLMAFALVAFGTVTTPANAQENATTVTGELPRTMAAPIRILPVAGTSSFATDDELQTDEFDGFTAGILADVGSRFWTFESGILAIQGRGVTDADNQRASIDIDSWGIPLLAKVNFSGKPHETVFLKAGAMPFVTSGDVEDTDVMGVAGIGGALPLGRNSSFQLDATYNRSFTTSGDLTDFQGLSILAGLAFNL